MESAVKQRLVQFIKMMHLTQRGFEELCGMGNGYVNSIRKGIGPEKMQSIIRAFPQLNREWLLYGEGEMLKSPFINSGDITITGNGNSNIGHNNVPARTCDRNCEYCSSQKKVLCKECGSENVELIEAEEVRRPIIPTEWTYQPNVDLYEKIQTDAHAVSRSRFIALDVPIDMWHIVRDDSLFPDCKRGDMLALSAYPIGQENPIPGKLHAVDTYSNGIIIRKLHYADYGFKGVAPNTEYPDMRIAKEDVIRVYRIVCLARIAL